MTNVLMPLQPTCQSGYHQRCKLPCRCSCHFPAPKRNEPRPPNNRRASFEDDLLHYPNVNKHEDSGLIRPSRDTILLEVAHVIAKRGTCSRARVGAVIARDGRIIATGYNGAPAGMAHCNHGAAQPDTTTDTEHGDIPSGRVGCTRAEHAERNAIAYAARYGLGTDGSNLYTTHAPCLDCSRSIINSGILRVYYDIPYRLIEGIELLFEAGVEVIRLES